MNFARTQSKDIVFITDDVKTDWWESENEKRIFHHKLVAEFKKTGRTIIACESQDFYTAVSDDYGIEKTDADVYKRQILSQWARISMVKHQGRCWRLNCRIAIPKSLSLIHIYQADFCLPF